MDITDDTGTSSGGTWGDLHLNVGNQLPLGFGSGRPRDPLQPSSSGFPGVKVGSPSQRDAGREHPGGGEGEEDEEEEKLGPMKEMMYRIASMQPVDIDPATIKKPRRRNVRISDDPQSTAARHRRERISERIRILQMLVPGGTKLDTASTLDEAIRYVKYLKRQVQVLQSNQDAPPAGMVAGHLSPPADWAATTAEALAFTSTATTTTSSSSFTMGTGGGSSGGDGAALPPPGLGFFFPRDGSCSRMH